jgi:hypothetical protein
MKFELLLKYLSLLLEWLKMRRMTVPLLELRVWLILLLLFTVPFCGILGTRFSVGWRMV